MAYGRDKFDAPVKRVSQKDGNVYEAIPRESARKALVGMGNRVLGGTSGTGQVPVLAGCGTGATGGARFTNVVAAVINGRLGTITAQANLELPAGTQADATYVKYLISSGFGSSGTITAGNEGTDGTSAHLPNLPDGHAALGYFQYQSTCAFPRANAVLGTCGIGSDWTNLVSVPFTD